MVNNVTDEVKSVVVMVIVQIMFTGLNIFYKVAANHSVNFRVLIAYRFLFAAAFISPLAFFRERKSRPKLTWRILGQSFLCGLLGGTLAQNLYLAGLALTSATFASAMTNLVPAITFILALSFRLERLGLRTKSGKAKVMGTLTGISGAMLFTFFKGFQIQLWSANLHLLQQHPNPITNHPHHQALGAFLSLASCISYAAWLIAQAKMIEEYPCYYSSTALVSWMGALQSVAFALCMDRDWVQWKLGWNITLYAAAYSGIIGSGIMVTLISWCVRMRGPLFVSMFNPLMLILVALSCSFLFDEKLYIGSVVGAILIVIGLYGVLWGKAKEIKKITKLMPSSMKEDGEEIEIVSMDKENNNSSNKGKNGIIINDTPQQQLSMDDGSQLK